MLAMEQLNFRDPKLVKKVAAHIRSIAPSYSVKICHVCGTHEWTITHYGLRTLLPETVDVIAGPGCPSACSQRLKSMKLYSWRIME